MKIAITYNKLAQFFFYFYHLTEWHFSASKEVADQWVKQTGDLNREEQSTLRKVKQIFRRYSFGDRYPGTVFIEKNEDMIFQELRYAMSQNDSEVLIGAFEIFNSRFERLWESDKPKLTACAEVLGKVISEEKFSSLTEKIGRLFGTLPDVLKMKLFSLPEQSAYMGGSANTPGNAATVEVRSVDDCIAALFVALHELTHKLVRKSGLSFKMRGEIRADILDAIPFFKYMSKEESLEELFLNFFLPDGYLAKEYDRDIHLEKKLIALSVELHAYMKKIVGEGKHINKSNVSIFKNFFLQKKKPSEVPAASQ